MIEMEREDLKEMHITVRHCARCDGTHEDMRFVTLLNAVDEWRFWASCPNTEQPVLLTIKGS